MKYVQMILEPNQLAWNSFLIVDCGYDPSALFLRGETFRDDVATIRHEPLPDGVSEPYRIWLSAILSWPPHDIPVEVGSVNERHRPLFWPVHEKVP
jgi:hypothetical protein